MAAVAIVAAGVGGALFWVGAQQNVQGSSASVAPKAGPGGRLVKDAKDSEDAELRKTAHVAGITDKSTETRGRSSGNAALRVEVTSEPRDAEIVIDESDFVVGTTPVVVTATNFKAAQLGKIRVRRPGYETLTVSLSSRATGDAAGPVHVRLSPVRGSAVQTAASPRSSKKRNKMAQGLPPRKKRSLKRSGSGVKRRRATSKVSQRKTEASPVPSVPRVVPKGTPDRLPRSAEQIEPVKL